MRFAARSNRVPAAALALLLGITGCAERRPPPNVVLVSFDCMSPRLLRVYQPSAPELLHLERFARAGVVFERAHAAAPWTLPSHASLLTGVYPDRHGATDFRHKIRPATPALAAELQRAGWETVAFTDGGFVDGDYGFAAGFDRYDRRARAGTRAARLALPREGGTVRQFGSVLFDRAIAYLAQRREGDPPFFLFLHTYALHDYFSLNPWALAAAEGVELRSPDDYSDCTRGVRTGSAQEWRMFERLYRAEAVHLDEAFGHLEAALLGTPGGDRTLVLLTADHGEAFDVARGRIHHGGRLHADLIRVPLMVRGPGLAAARLTVPVTLVDVMPTVLEMAGVAAPAGLDGVSFAPALRRRDPAPAAPAPRALFAMEYCQYWKDGRRYDVKTPSAAPLTLARIEGESWFIQSASGDELYDMAADPGQTSNLAAASEMTDALRRELAEWRAGRAAGSGPGVH